MKAYKLKYILPFVFLGGILFSSCSEDTKDVSEIYTLPQIETPSPKFLTVPVGSSYTDVPPAAFAGSESLEVVTTGSVDTSKPGAYYLKYTAYILETVFVTEYRVVLVANESDITDISGEYANVTYGDPMTLTKLAPGIYRASETWWQAYPIPAEFADLGNYNFQLIRETASSRYGNFKERNGISFDPATEILGFDFIFTSGNTGLGWGTTWKKQ